MCQILALEEDSRPVAATGFPSEVLRLIERRRAADVVGGKTVDLGLEGGVVLRVFVRMRQLGDRRHERLWRELAAESPEASVGVGQLRRCLGVYRVRV
jgi:hypothetical protein